jgi:BlaI family transcriptional regulator, penicillinase repressor
LKSDRQLPMLTAAEAEIMNVVWERTPVAIADIVDQLPRELAYTTVMTTARILEDKGFLKQCGKRGRAFLYQPAIERSQVSSQMSHEVANRLFKGSIKSMMLSLVRDQSISQEDLAEVKQMIEQLEQKQ